MNPLRNLAKSEKILLALTGAFLCFLLVLYVRDRAALTEPGVAVETGQPVPYDVFVPEVSPIDVNTASAEELTTLPGIGPVLAERIVAYRTEHGPFLSEEDLMNVSGIGSAKLAGLEGQIVLGDVREAEDNQSE